MAAGRDSEFSSPFDAMLDQNRQRLDRLYRGPAGDDDRYSPATTAGSSAPVASPSARGRPAPTAARPPRARSDPARSLDERFGDRWRHEVVEQRRDGDDMVVRCRLTVAGQGVDLTRSGRARIDPTSARHEIIGSADGVPFSFRSDDASGAGGAEQDAVARAVEDALAKCVDAI